MSRVAIVGQDQALVDTLAIGLEGTTNADVVVVSVSEQSGVPDTEYLTGIRAQLRQAAHVVLISSAAVHEPTHRHPGMVSEEPLRPLRGNAVTARWREAEERMRDALEGTSTVLTILRPTALVVAGGQGYWSRLFAGRLAFPLLGFDPTVQLLTGQDLATAVRRVIEVRTPGVYHLAPRGIPLSKALRAARIFRLPLPFSLRYILRRLAAVFSGQTGGQLLGQFAGQLDYLRYSWTVSGEKWQRDFGVGPEDGLHQNSEHDDFGFDQDYVARLGKSLFRFLHDFWWRVEWRGLENVPRQGRAVLAGVHRGHQPWDGVMTLHLLHRELGRCPRFLIHPTLVKFPFLAPYLIKCGGVPACRENAASILEGDDILGIFPEGIGGAFRLYREAYQLGRFGRDEFVKMALRQRAPLIPYVIVGSAEVFPILGRIDWKWWKRISKWPFLPITPTMSLVPLPSKWHTWFLEPIHVEQRYPPEAADDPKIVKAISQEVRQRMEEAIAEMLRRRKSIFFGSIFTPPELGKEKV